mmetsp:Transcript_22503/g.27720  ORF Transcript_22503/g.27720 Transcript_22503/m.27720 type:complete len:405 (+) Transcript_22503:32-1246(+)
MVLCGDHLLGCCSGLRAFSWVKCRSAQTREPANGMAVLLGNGGAVLAQMDAPKEQLKTIVRAASEVHFTKLQEAALGELDAAVERLRKAQTPTPQTTASKFERSTSEKVTSTDEPSGAHHHFAVPGRKSLRRRWTTSMAQMGSRLTPALLAPLEDGDTPGNSTVVSAAASEVATDDMSDSPSLKPSLRDVRDSSKSKSKANRITFEGSAQAGELEKPQSSDEAEELPQCRRGSDASSVGRKSDTSSMNWRADALDVGENLAASAAAKKGRTSIDSILALVEEERERWDEEKQALEAQAEELKEQLRSMQAQHSPDAEKQALKSQYQELRKAMKARSRFGAWVCERHMMESDDEEPNAEKEELRHKISELSAKLRRAKASLGAASSESDVSPSRRSPGIMRHKYS